MGSTTRTIVSTVTLTAFLGLIFKALSLVLGSPTNRDHLESLNFRTIFEIDKDRFDVWKSKYFLHKEEIRSLIPEIKSAETDSQGAYLLKKWCEVRLSEYYSEDEFKKFDMLKKYCTLDKNNK